MKRNREEQLEKLENWDIEKAEATQPVKSIRHVVSVSLSSDEFERISKYAESMGKKISQFMRDASIEKTFPLEENPPVVYLTGGPGTQWATNQLSNITIVEGPQVDLPLEPDAVTI